MMTTCTGADFTKKTPDSTVCMFSKLPGGSGYGIRPSAAKRRNSSSESSNRSAVHAAQLYTCKVKLRVEPAVPTTRTSRYLCDESNCSALDKTSDNCRIQNKTSSSEPTPDSWQSTDPSKEQLSRAPNATWHKASNTMTATPNLKALLISH
jgi:hypothetical protein